MSAPFGIELFTPIANFEVLHDHGQHKYAISAPSPHPAFVSYVVQATPSSGVVWIKGNGEYRSIDAFGNSLRSDVDRIADQLAIKYGQGRKTDLLLTGAMWDEPQYWMHALADGQRYYSYMWERSKIRGLPDDIESIYVGAQSGGNDQGAVAIEYSSIKMSEAEQEVERSLADLL